MSPRFALLCGKVLASGYLAWALYKSHTFPDFLRRWTPRRPRPGRWTPEQIVDAVDLCLHLIRRRRCFLRSLLIYRLLRQMSEEPIFVIGVRHGPGGGLLGHAWIENGGQVRWPYGDDPRLYTVVLRYPYIPSPPGRGIG